MKKTLRTSASGVYYYFKEELPAMGLTSIPREYKNQRIFGVYRPASVIADSVSLFPGAPVANNHLPWTERDNFLNALGKVADCQTHMLDGEMVVDTIVDMNEDYKEFAGDKVQVSPGYEGTHSWRAGVSPSGEAYQIVCKSINAVDHVALVPKARGGENMRILDGGNMIPKKIVSGLVWFARHFTKVADSADGTDVFINTLNDVKENAARWTEEEMKEHVLTLEAVVKDLPDTEEKEKLIRCLADLPLLQSEGEETLGRALELLANLYQSLEKDAMEDVMIPENTPVVEEQKIDDGTAVEGTGSEEAEVSMLQKLTENVQALTEAIKALLGDKGAALGAPVETPKEKEPKKSPAEKSEEVEEKKEERVGDSISTYSSSLASTANGESLDSFFASFKGKGA